MGLSCMRASVMTTASKKAFSPIIPGLRPSHDKPLEWAEGRYWDTTIAGKHPYWRDFDLPHPTKDIDWMRCGIVEWGYCFLRRQR
jgi:hypothetical protein